MPLLQPGEVLKSAVNSKFEKRSRVMMSPPACASASPLVKPGSTVSTPSAMLQLFAGNSSDFGLRQPSVVLPSHSKRQPSAFSRAVSVLCKSDVSGPRPRQDVKRAHRRAHSPSMDRVVKNEEGLGKSFMVILQMRMIQFHFLSATTSSSQVWLKNFTHSAMSASGLFS